jgi:gluconate kinase
MNSQINIKKVKRQTFRDGASINELLHLCLKKEVVRNRIKERLKKVVSAQKIENE